MWPATLEVWTGWGLDERQVWLDALLERLPAWLSRLEGREHLPRFEDTRFGQRFVLVLEAPVVIGLTRERQEEVDAALARDWLQLFSPEVHVPARRAQVSTHLAGLRPMQFEGHEWVHRDNRARLAAELRTRGWRLPSEAEWELQWRVARRLAPLEFGQVELCADEWHVGYEGAPTDGRPWGTGAEVVREWDQFGASVEAVMPSRRPVRSASITQVRPVIDLPL